MTPHWRANLELPTQTLPASVLTCQFHDSLTGYLELPTQTPSLLSGHFQLLPSVLQNSRKVMPFLYHARLHLVHALGCRFDISMFTFELSAPVVELDILRHSIL